MQDSLRIGIRNYYRVVRKCYKFVIPVLPKNCFQAVTSYSRTAEL